MSLPLLRYSWREPPLRDADRASLAAALGHFGKQTFLSQFRTWVGTNPKVPPDVVALELSVCRKRGDDMPVPTWWRAVFKWWDFAIPIGYGLFALATTAYVTDWGLLPFLLGTFAFGYSIYIACLLFSWRRYRKWIEQLSVSDLPPAEVFDRRTELRMVFVRGDPYWELRLESKNGSQALRQKSSGV